MLSEVGVRQSVEEARNIMEGIRSLRIDTLAKLLVNCRRVKVRLLCVAWAEELNLPWAAEARTATKTRRHSRWTARLKNGTLLNIRP